MTSAPTTTSAPGAAPDGRADGAARADIMRTLGAIRAAQALYAATRLGLPDELDRAPRSTDELASATATDPDAVRRLLRALATMGVVEAATPDRWTATAGSDLLRADRPDGLRNLVLFNGSPPVWAAFGALDRAVSSGRPGFDSAVGEPIRAHACRDAEFGTVVDAAMRSLDAQQGATYRALLSFDPGTHVADVGGGTGALLARTLLDNPGTTGVLVDRPDVLERAESELGGSPARPRIGMHPADATVDDLPVADVYVLKTLLHLHDDAAAGAILDRVRRVAPRGARVLILERVLAEPGVPDPGTLLDLDMLTIYGGRDRSVTEWDALLSHHGWWRTNDPAVGTWTVVEASPAGAV